MKLLKRIVVILAVLWLVVQVIRPAKTNPPVDGTRTIQANTQMTAEVAAILERSCSDCHSYKTKWPWYSEVAPLSWYLTHDVNEGRTELSLSDCARDTVKKAARKLRQICEEVEKSEMPTKPYLLLDRKSTRLNSSHRTISYAV